MVQSISLQPGAVLRQSGTSLPSRSRGSDRVPSYFGWSRLIPPLVEAPQLRMNPRPVCQSPIPNTAPSCPSAGRAPRSSKRSRLRVAGRAMKVEDYFTEGRRAWFRLHEKGGKRHEVPAHHNAESYLDAYVEAAGIASDKKGPLFRSIDRHRKLTGRPLTSRNALDMIKGRAKTLGLPDTICNHTFRATGITVFRQKRRHRRGSPAHRQPRQPKDDDAL